MHIRQAISIEATPERAMEAARNWMRGELHDLGAEIVETRLASGATSIESSIMQDGIRMTTSIASRPHNTGSRLTLDLRTQGIDLGARLRNVGLLPGRRIVTRQVRASLAGIRAEAEQ